MREVFRDRELAWVGFYQSMLENAGITCYIANACEESGSFAGASWPTLCVVSDEDHARAVSLLAEALAKPPADAPGWTCPRCREEVPGTFGSCWACGAMPA